MSKIDELPLDIFDEDAAAPGADSAAPTLTPDPEPAVVPWAAPDVSARTKIFDIVGVVAAIALTGLALRVIGAGFTTPVFNVALAIFVYFRMGKLRRQWYYDRASSLLDRFQADIAAVKEHDTPQQVAAYPIVYDIGIVVAAALANRMLFWMTGFDRMLPGPFLFTVSLALAITAYVASFQLIERTALHIWVYERISSANRSR